MAESSTRRHGVPRKLGVRCVQGHFEQHGAVCSLILVNRIIGKPHSGPASVRAKGTGTIFEATGQDRRRSFMGCAMEDRGITTTARMASLLDLPAALA